MDETARYKIGYVVGFAAVVVPIITIATFAYKYGKVNGRLEVWKQLKTDLKNISDSLPKPE